MTGKRKAPDDEVLSRASTVTRDAPREARGSSKSTKLQQRRGEAARSSQTDDVYYRNLYTVEPDFRQLAQQDAEFAAILKPNRQLDFTDPATVMQLTKTLLKIDFGLEIELPDDRLCPPIPNRHNYILWLKDLLDSTSYNRHGGKLSGLDIGTGASCIYPLLGCTQRPWYFIATDVDTKSLSFARKNVELNGLQDRIKVFPRQLSDSLIPLDDLGLDALDFCMINPPFYVSEEDLVSSAKKKVRPPNSACTGAPVEMVCDGGEVAFVSRLLDESLVLKERVRWYTSMFGKVSSLEILVDKLRENGIDNYAVTEFVQGNKTRRWALGWSFGPMRPAQDVARGMKATAWRKILPVQVEAQIQVQPVTKGVGELGDKIEAVIGTLELISWEWDKEPLRGVGRARENVWGRAWRRKKFQKKPLQDEEISKSLHEGAEICTFGFIISVRIGVADIVTDCRWCEGHDASIFESFCGFLKSNLSSN